MKPSQRSLTPTKRWQRSIEAVGVDAVVVPAIEAVVAVEVEQQLQEHQLQVQRPVTKEQNIQTYPKVNGRGAVCISGGGRGLSSAQSPPPVRGKTSSPPNLKNEPGTSSVLLKQK